MTHSWRCCAREIADAARVHLDERRGERHHPRPLSEEAERTLVHLAEAIGLVPLRAVGLDDPDAVEVASSQHRGLELVGERGELLEAGMRLQVEFLEGRPVNVVFPEMLEVRIADTWRNGHEIHLKPGAGDVEG